MKPFTRFTFLLGVMAFLFVGCGGDRYGHGSHCAGTRGYQVVVYIDRIGHTDSLQARARVTATCQAAQEAT